MQARLSDRISIVVLTHNRRECVLATLAHLAALPERCEAWVVDNGSTDGTVQALATQSPAVHVVRLHENLGAAGRNAGVRAAGTPYVAFCDDDTWWAPGSLARAVALLDRHPNLAVLSARVLVGADEHLDPTCLAMAASPLHHEALPGPLLLGYLAGACVVRREAFLAVGGYHPRLFLGAEEALVALDLTARGRFVMYADGLVVHHQPASRSDSAARRQRLARNAIWIAWLRRPMRAALGETLRVLRERGRHSAGSALVDALRGAGWVWRERRVVPPQVERMLWSIRRAEKQTRRRPD